MLDQSPTFGDPRLPARFWAKVRVLENGCWEWAAYRSLKGYGVTGVGRRAVYAHRWAYERLIGTFPLGLQSDHLCRRRACVNPTHIEPVTSRENTLRGMGLAAVCAKKTHCPQGHAYDEVNTYVFPNGRHRLCRICGRIRDKQRKRTR